MWEAIIWTTLGVLVCVGLTLMSINPADFTIARICFSFAALIAAVRISWWMLLEPQTRPKIRKILGMSLTLIVISSALWASLSWVDKREIIMTVTAPLKEIGRRDSFTEAPKKPSVQAATTNKTEATLPPDLSGVKQTLINSNNQLLSSSQLKDVSGIVPGFFEMSGGPAPGTPYSNPSVTTKDTFSTHFYASVRLAALENVQTMDFMGRDIYVCILPDWSGYMIWESEQSQTVWKPILVEKNPILNTVAISQKGRNVDIFINNNYVDSFTKLRSPQPGPIGIYLKANATKGGKMFFRDFSVWDFGSQ
jgi:hypothetical protein